MHTRSIATDIIKGFLVILMIVYHSIYVAAMFGYIAVNMWTGFMWWLPRFIAASFLFMSGWNLASKRENGYGFNAFVARFAKLLALALVISLATYIALRENFVFFGIIHCMALSAVLIYPLLKKPYLALAMGLVVLGLGLYLGTMRFDFFYLSFLGFRPKDIFPSDFEPLLPWFAWVCFGVSAFLLFAKKSEKAKALGQKIKKSKQKSVKKQLNYNKAITEYNFFVRFLAFLGRNTLWVYVIHLPLLYGIGILIQMIFN